MLEILEAAVPKNTLIVLPKLVPFKVIEFPVEPDEGDKLVSVCENTEDVSKQKSRINLLTTLISL